MATVITTMATGSIKSKNDAVRMMSRKWPLAEAQNVMA